MSKKSKLSAKPVVKRKDEVFHPNVIGLDKCFGVYSAETESVPDDVKRQFSNCFMYLPVFGIDVEPIGTNLESYREIVASQTPHLVVRLMLGQQHHTTKYCVLVDGNPKLQGRPIPAEYHNYTFFASRGRAGEVVQGKRGRKAGETLREFTFVP